MAIDNQIKYNTCPYCDKSYALDSETHYCHYPVSKQVTTSTQVNPPTLEELRIRIEKLEHNYRELLKALQQKEG